MISLQNKHFTAPGSNLDYTASPDGKRAWFLCTWHPENSHELEEIQAQIKLEILNASPLTISKLEIENWLKNLYSEFHWKLHASMRKSNLVEKGISLLFGVLYDGELFFVQFGRIFAALADAKGVSPVGKNWKHAHISTAKDLELLGFSEHDLKIKPVRTMINDDQSLVIVPGVIAGKLFEQMTDSRSLDALLSSYASSGNAMWLVLTGKPDFEPKKRKKLSRLQISSIILLLVTLLAILYVSFGNRFMDTGFRKLGMLFRSRTANRLEQLPQTLNISNAEVIKIMDKVVNSPARNIQCRMAWNTDLPYVVTANPAFDLNQIYLAAGKTLLAYDKKSRNLLWSINLESEIVSLQKTQVNLVAGLANRNLMGFKADGSPSWTTKTNREPRAANTPRAIELTNSDDARIDGSIIVIPEEKGISILESNRGENLSNITLVDKLAFLSAYDSYANCFYAVAGNSLICLELKILN